MERRPIQENEIIQSIELDSVAVSQCVTLIRKERESLTEIELLHDYLRL